VVEGEEEEEGEAVALSMARRRFGVAEDMMLDAKALKLECVGAVRYPLLEGRRSKKVRSTGIRQLSSPTSPTRHRRFLELTRCWLREM
jgi:hypothetical protein